MNEKIAKKLRKMMKRVDDRMKFEADKFFISMLKQPFKQRLKLAWRILRGGKK